MASAGAGTSGLVADHVRRLGAVAHGSVAAAELAPLGLTPGEVLDFSVNTNPLGPAPTVLRALEATVWTRYPGDDDAPFRQRLAERAALTTEYVALGNGSAELLWLLCLAVLRPGDRVDVVVPTFGEYARAARVLGANVVEVQRPDDVSGAARIVFICNPNNPTADHRSRDVVERLLATAPGRVVVLDEAYAAFDPQRWSSEPLLKRHANLVILRSMTKDHALPGLRLGYALAAPPLARALEAVRPPWSVNAGALRAGLAAQEPDAQAHVLRAVAVVETSRRLLTDGLRDLGLKVADSSANFLLVEVGDGRAFRRALLPAGLVVRDCASFGLPRHVRVACLRPNACERLLAGVRRVVDDWRASPR